MLFLIAVIISVLFVWLCGKPLKKYPTVFYIGAAVITAVLILINQAHLSGIPEFLSKWVMPIFTKGILAAALWCIVAWTGALPNGSKPIKHIMPVRGELSIFAAIITLSHAVTYGITYIRRITSGNNKTDFIISFVICLVLMIIMLPLTVMSFKAVRKKMNAKKWKNIQKSAYIFYALIYVHILVIYMQKPSNTENIISILVYSAVFLLYAVFRLKKYFNVRKKEDKKIIVNALILCASVLTVISPLVLKKAPVSRINNTANIETAEIKVTTTIAEKSDEITTILKNTTTAKKEKNKVTATTATEVETIEITEDEETEEITENTEETEQNEPENDIQEQPEESPVYIYQNGTYTASAYGYDGDVTVTVTIENDIITDITASTSESDSWYFDSAFETVRDRILISQNISVDAVSGATYSSNAIMSAVQKALDSARN